MKFEFFEFQSAERPKWIEKAKATTTAIWQSKYKSASRATSPFFSVSREGHQTGPEEPMRRQRKRAHLAAERHDEFKQFQTVEEQLHGIGPLKYWIHKRQSSDSRTPDLAAMGTDILSIPAMLAEPEPVFSRYYSFSIVFFSLFNLILR